MGSITSPSGLAIRTAVALAAEALMLVAAAPDPRSRHETSGHPLRRDSARHATRTANSSWGAAGGGASASPVSEFRDAPRRETCFGGGTHVGAELAT
jgi:hypothetical protein